VSCRLAAPDDFKASPGFVPSVSYGILACENIRIIDLASSGLIRGHKDKPDIIKTLRWFRNSRDN